VSGNIECMEQPPSRARSFEVGILIFDDVTLLDVAGPLEVLARIPDARARLVATRDGPVRCDTGCALTAEASFADVSSFDLLVVPGGPGIDALLEDDAALRFVRRAYDGGALIASVCTGALLLGAAGCLRGRRATTHWRYLDLLSAFGAEPVAMRVVTDGNVITSAGVSAGIDMALALAARIGGEEQAARIALAIEYDPAPPVRGSAQSSTPATLATFRADTAARYAVRAAIVARAAAKTGAAAS
jgi:cyclohexyl-isocyanide hydratase